MWEGNRPIRRDLILDCLLGFFASQQHIVNLLESLVNISLSLKIYKYFFSKKTLYLGSGKDELARYEDEQHNLWFLHFIDETGKHLWLVGTKLFVLSV